MRQEPHPCSITPPSRLRLPTDTQAPRLARDFLTNAFCPVHNAQVMDDAKLLVSELVTNALQHGTPPISMCVECDAIDGLRISVSDGDRSDPIPRQAAPDAESGRGMRLVDVISDQWGIDHHDGDGKDIWFRLRD